MRRAIVHVGLPRTGTTTVQRVLTRLRPELLRAGILYPELTPRSAAEPHLSHQHLGEALDGRRPRRELAELLDSLAQKLTDSDADTVVLSYEHLCLVPPRRGIAGLLARFFERHGFTMEVLATIKPQAEFLNSTYTWRTQFLRDSRGFTAFAHAELGRQTLDFAALFEPWRRACDGRMTVLPLRDPRSDEGLLARFFDAAGLGRVRGLITPDDLALAENASPGPIAVEVCRRLSMQGARRRLGPRSREATRWVEEDCRQRNLDAASFKGVDAALRQMIEARWHPANARLAAVAWGEPWSARVGRAPDAAINELARIGGPADLREAELLVASAGERFGLPRSARGWLHFNPLRRFGHSWAPRASR
jgi:hypothetical protein